MRDEKKYYSQGSDSMRRDSKAQPKRPDPEQEKKDKKKKRRRRKRRLILFLILLLILIGIVLGLLYGGKLGLGDGWGFLPGVSADKNGGTQGGGEDDLSQAETDNKPTSVATVTPEPTQQAEGITAPDAFITVSEDKILLNSTELDIDGLKAQLENAYKGGKVTLIDDYAIKDTYESVKSLLEALGITEYEEKKAD